jgi:hypothetical protein
MLVAGALALLIFVVAAIVALLALDIGRRENRHWLDALKSWQQLIGAVLGFLGAAGVLVLSSAIQTNIEQVRAQNTAHAVGLALAIEVERIGVGLKLGKAIGQTIDLANDPNLARTCLNYSRNLQAHLLAETPVYDAVLSKTSDFGESNLATFIRFYGYFDDFKQGLKEVDEPACNAAPADEITYMEHQIDGGLSFYAYIATLYDIAPLEAGMASQEPSPPPTASSTPST